MADAENPDYENWNPDYEDWNPDTDSQPPIPVPEPHNQGVLCEGNGHKPNKEVDETKQFIQRTRTIEWLQFWVNATLATVGVVAVIIYLCQLIAMSKTLREIQKQTPEIQKQAKAAQDQLAQAKADSIASGVSTAKQLALMQRQLAQQGNVVKLEQRPWIGANNITCIECSHTSSDGTLHIGALSINLQNTGKTPAIKVLVNQQLMDLTSTDPTPRYHPRAEITSRNPYDSKIIELGNRFRGVQPFVLAPNESHLEILARNLNWARKTRVSLEEEKIIYFVGEITYYSTWDNKTVHTTRFCLFNETGTEFHYCDSGNDMD
jgi:hypothetical protein